MDSTRGRRWWPRWAMIRLSLRATMALVLILGGGMGWLLHRARVQSVAVATIQRAEGSVGFNTPWQPWWVPGPRAAPPAKPPRWANWLRKSIGPDFFDTAKSVHLMGGPADDEALSAACRLSQLEQLTVISTGATDASAEQLGGLTNLRSLDLRLNKITGRPLRHLGRMTGLRELKLAMRMSPVPLKDQDMSFFKYLTGLERLMLPSKDLTGKWLVYLEGATSLVGLELYDMAIADGDLVHLSRLTKLENLTLHGTRITTLEPLRPLANLSGLCVPYTEIDDDDLASMPDFPRLTYLDLRRTKVTAAGVAEFSKRRPAVKINR